MNTKTTPRPKRHSLSLNIEWATPWDLFLKLQAWAIILTVLSVAVLVSSVRAVLTPRQGAPGLGCATIAPVNPESLAHEHPHPV